MAKFLIHACPERLWYVNDFLIPELLDQGIKKSDIVTYCDKDGKGNLEACMESFSDINKFFPKAKEDGIWHLQDDVYPSSSFYRTVRQYDVRGIVNGFGNSYFEGSRILDTGSVKAFYTWYSFQCIRIPNDIARGCADWFYGIGSKYDKVRECISTGKGDDAVWRIYIQNYYKDIRVTNLNPNIVEHVDELMGGSVTSPERAVWRRSAFWEEPERIEELKERIEAYGRSQKG